MGLNAAAHAAQLARLTPTTTEPTKPRRGHAQGKYIDRSRTDAHELSIGICGRGITGCMPHHPPGDPVSWLEHTLKDERRHQARHQQALTPRGIKPARCRNRVLARLPRQRTDPLTSTSAQPNFKQQLSQNSDGGRSCTCRRRPRRFLVLARARMVQASAGASARVEIQHASRNELHSQLPTRQQH
jgi:hypothetical protein